VERRVKALKGKAIFVNDTKNSGKRAGEKLFSTPPAQHQIVIGTSIYD
jgi:hypothetical protein